MKHRKHKVRLYFWGKETLTRDDKFFESFAEALEYANHSGAFTVKIYDRDENLIHCGSPKKPEHHSYA